jgi:hypothetical protein
MRPEATEAELTAHSLKRFDHPEIPESCEYVRDGGIDGPRFIFHEKDGYEVFCALNIVEGFARKVAGDCMYRSCIRQADKCHAAGDDKGAQKWLSVATEWDEWRK